MPTDSDSRSTAYLILARKLLQGAPGFEQCPAQTIDSLLEGAVLAHLKKAEQLVRRGDGCEHLILCVEGSLETSVATREGRRHLLAFVGPGMLVGLLPFVDKGGMAHDTVAHTPAVVLKMPFRHVASQRAVDPTLRAAFEIQLAVRSRRLYDMVAERMLHSLRERLALQLVELVGSFGLRRGQAWTITLKLPQSDLADLLGATRQSINTELRALEKVGLIHTAHAHIDVLDLPALKSECSRMVAGGGNATD
jgi:CRP-like cAMP-binding protein